MSIPVRLAASVFLAFLLTLPAGASTPVAVLDFQLNDLTSNPGVPEELERTASLRPLLEKSLAAKGVYRMIDVDRAAQTAASPAMGYLWDYPDEAAALGKSNEARYVLVGRLTKPSFLFAYLEARLIDANAGKAIGKFYVEVKGQQARFTPRGVDRLAEQIDAALRALEGAANRP